MSSGDGAEPRRGGSDSSSMVPPCAAEGLQVGHADNTTEEFRNGINYTSLMQEFLQKKAPHLNPWHFFKTTDTECAPFKIRVALQNLKSSANTMSLPESDALPTKKEAKQNVSWKVLSYLKQNIADLGTLPVQAAPAPDVVSSDQPFSLHASHADITTEEFRNEINYTSPMQEFLQKKAPHLGCDCKNLWRFVETTKCAPFKIRVALQNLESSAITMSLPESDALPTKKEAKQNASWKALSYLKYNDDNLLFEGGSIILRSTRGGGSGGASCGQSHPGSNTSGSNTSGSNTSGSNTSGSNTSGSITNRYNGGGCGDRGSGSGGARGGRNRGDDDVGENSENEPDRRESPPAAVAAESNFLQQPTNESTAQYMTSALKKDDSETELSEYFHGLMFGEIKPRDYQCSAAGAACSENTIINIETGGGKTLIAIMVIKYFLEKFPHKKVMFIAPTVSLVQQQKETISMQCTFFGPSRKSSNVIVTECCGTEVNCWIKSVWSNILSSSHVVIGTPEVFRNALVSKGYISLDQFSLIIMDECHNATGNSAMASIMLDSVFKHFYFSDDLKLPRIVGLTGSFVSGKLSNIEMKRKELEELLQSSMISPVLPDDVKGCRKFQRIKVPNEEVDLAIFEDGVREYIMEAFRAVPEFSQLIPLDKQRNWCEKGVRVFKALGALGLRFWLQEGLVLQLKAEADNLAHLDDPRSVEKSKRMKYALDAVTIGESVLNMGDATISINLIFPSKSQKYVALLKKLEELRDNLGKEFRGIIFVKEVALTYPLAWSILNDFSIDLVDSYPMVLPVSGTGGMLDTTRNQNLELFRSGLVPLLVSTTALEEGIDVPDCRFVIRYDEVDTTKSHIQGSGRARCPNSDVYYFENDPDVECAKAAYLDRVAKDVTLNISKDDMHNFASTVSCVPYQPGRMPYPYNSTSGIGGEVSIFNCSQLFFNYIQSVMQQSVPEECLLQYSEEGIDGKKLKAVLYPSPAGVCEVTRQVADEFWGNISIDDVNPAKRLKSYSQLDKDKCRMIYVAVVKMRQDGLLDDSNNPSSEAKAKTKLACDVYLTQPRLNLKNKFKNASLFK